MGFTCNAILLDAALWDTLGFTRNAILQDVALRDTLGSTSQDTALWDIASQNTLGCI